MEENVQMNQSVLGAHFGDKQSLIDRGNKELAELLSMRASLSLPKIDDDGQWITYICDNYQKYQAIKLIRSQLEGAFTLQCYLDDALTKEMVILRMRIIERLYRDMIEIWRKL